MTRDFEVKDGIYIVQGDRDVDLHNEYRFIGFRYLVNSRRLDLHWERSDENCSRENLPQSVDVQFREVSEFRFSPRNSALPFSEDDCLHVFGYWIDEDWAKGVIEAEEKSAPEPHWPTALEFMSGAIIVVQAQSAHATLK